MSIAENLSIVRSQIDRACINAGRDPGSVTLVAVSKTHTPSKVLEAAALGMQHFGENRVEEAQGKITVVRAQSSSPLVWHMIGHIQSRKARDVAPLFDVVQSVDSVKLASKLAASASETRRLKVLVEVNVSGEESKQGFSCANWQEERAVFGEFAASIHEIAGFRAIELAGLMTMAPIVEDMEQARPVFARLRKLRDALQEKLGLPLPELSMGMTDDYPVAIEEGATIVRIGRAIFGERQVVQANNPAP